MAASGSSSNCFLYLIQLALVLGANEKWGVGNLRRFEPLHLFVFVSAFRLLRNRQFRNDRRALLFVDSTGCVLQLSLDPQWIQRSIRSDDRIDTGADVAVAIGRNIGGSTAVPGGLASLHAALIANSQQHF